MHYRLYYHLVWTTRDRAPLTDAAVAAFLCRFLPPVAAQERARALAIGMVQSHVHLLLSGDPQTNLPRLIMRLKGGSSMTANRDRISLPTNPLRWEKSYSIQSVSPSGLVSVREYICNQHRRHPAERIPNWDPHRAAIEDANSAGNGAA